MASTWVRWRAVGLQLGEDRLAATVAELVIERVQAERGPQDRVVADQPAQAGLDEVVERVVARSAVGRVGGTRQVGRERRVGQWRLLEVQRRRRVFAGRRDGAGRGQAVATIGCLGGAVADTVSARASRVARIAASMSSAETSWWVTART